MIDITQDDELRDGTTLTRDDPGRDLTQNPDADLQGHEGEAAPGGKADASPLDAALADARERFDAIVASTRQALGRLKAAAQNSAHGMPTLQWMAEPQSGEGEDEAAPELDALARQLAIAAYNNRDNAIWDPLDPSTYRVEPDEDSALLRVLSQAADETPSGSDAETAPAAQASDEAASTAYLPGLRLLI